MIETCRQVVAQAAQLFADKRVNLCEIEVVSADEGQVELAGRVLDEAVLVAVRAALAENCLGLSVDDRGVVVLRAASPHYLSVACNLTSLHVEPSWLAEMSSQLLFGWRLEVLEERGRWVFVRQEDGYLGWAYRAYLSEQMPAGPAYLVTAPVSPLRERPELGAGLVSRVLGGTSLRVDEREGEWGRVALAVPSAQGPVPVAGWLPLAGLRAMDALPRTSEERRAQMMTDALTMIGVPYLWGGCTANGIDCSGFSQLLHRWVGVIIPRDADMQYAAGRKVSPPYQPGDLFFFGENGDKSKITHVTISRGGWQIIHSTRSRDGVYLDDVQAVPHLRENFIGAASFLE